MTLDYWDGFDEYASLTDAAMFGWSNAMSISASGRVSGSACSLANQNAILSNASIVSGTRQTIGFAWRTSNPAVAGAVCQWREGVTEHMRLTYNGDGTFTISRAGSSPGFSGGSATSSAVTVGASIYYYIEVDMTCSDTVGAWEMKFAGTTIGSGTGGDTRNGGTGVLNTLYLQAPNGTGSLFDDLYIASGSTSFQGDSRVITSTPNASGNYSQWTPNASTNVSRINQTTQDGDTTYNSDATSGHRDSYGFAALGVTGTVLGVIAHCIARKDDAGARNLKMFYRTGGTDYDGSSQALTSSYAGFWRTDLTKPAGGSWTVSDVDATEVGYLDV